MDTAVALKLHDDLLASQPEGARHDSDICPFCVEKASRIPPAAGSPDVSENNTTSTEGGTTPTMSDISQEAHDALVKKAVDEALKATETALATKTQEAADAAAKVTELETANASLKADNDRINKELDEAQVSLKAASEEVASLKSDIAQKDEEAKLAELASERAKQVTNLKLFPEEYVSEKASAWASMDTAAWDERVEEWKRLKPAGEGAPVTDAASAMSGTNEDLTKEKPTDEASASAAAKSSRRGVLGLA